MGATRAADVDNDPWLAVFYSEVGGSFPDEAEGGRVVHIQDRVPLLVCDLVDHTVPRITGVVDDDMNLAVSELGGLLDQHFDVVGIGHVAGDRKGTAGAGVVDGFGRGFGSGAVDVAHNHFSPFIGEQSCTFGPDALAGPGDLRDRLSVTVS